MKYPLTLYSPFQIVAWWSTSRQSNPRWTSIRAACLARAALWAAARNDHDGSATLFSALAGLVPLPPRSLDATRLRSLVDALKPDEQHDLYEILKTRLGE